MTRGPAEWCQRAGDKKRGNGLNPLPAASCRDSEPEEWDFGVFKEDKDMSTEAAEELRRAALAAAHELAATTGVHLRWLAHARGSPPGWAMGQGRCNKVERDGCVAVAWHAEACVV